MKNMISKEEIKKLADLARIEIKEEEQEELALEIEEILGYVGQVKSVVNSEENAGLPLSVPSPEQGEGLHAVRGGVFNVFRADAEGPTESGTYSKELIAEFPNSENNYLKVKKIL